MQEIGIDSKLLTLIKAGQKTLEVRLGRGKFLKFRTGDKISIREDVYENGELVKSTPNQATVQIKQLLYFETFEELFSAVDFRKALPEENTVREAITFYRTLYSAEEEEENGVVAIEFTLT